MPNWCSNSITISGPKDKIKDLYDRAMSEGDDGLLNAMHPMPAELNDTTAPSEDGADWYSWRVNNWGTKWDVNLEGEFTDNEDGTAEITGWFDSAWAPPIGAYETFLEANEDCSIWASYDEPGMDFAGVYEDGDDLYLEDVHTSVMDVLTGHKTLEETDPLFQKLNEEFEFIENRSQWYDLDDINSAREERGLEPLTEAEYEEMA
jgi:hypothetical protein